MTTTSIWRTSRTGPSMDSADRRPSEMTRIVRGVAGATIRTSSLWARVSWRTSRSDSGNRGLVDDVGDRVRHRQTRRERVARHRLGRAEELLVERRRGS